MTTRAELTRAINKAHDAWCMNDADRRSYEEFMADFALAHVEAERERMADAIRDASCVEHPNFEGCSEEWSDGWTTGQNEAEDLIRAASHAPEKEQRESSSNKSSAGGDAGASESGGSCGEVERPAVGGELSGSIPTSRTSKQEPTMPEPFDLEKRARYYADKAKAMHLGAKHWLHEDHAIQLAREAVEAENEWMDKTLATKDAEIEQLRQLVRDLPGQAQDYGYRSAVEACARLCEQIAKDRCREGTPSWNAGFFLREAASLIRSQNEQPEATRGASHPAAQSSPDRSDAERVPASDSPPAASPATGETPLCNCALRGDHYKPPEMHAASCPVRKHQLRVIAANRAASAPALTDAEVLERAAEILRRHGIGHEGASLAATCCEHYSEKLRPAPAPAQADVFDRAAHDYWDMIGHASYGDSLQSFMRARFSPLVQYAEERFVGAGHCKLCSALSSLRGRAKEAK